MNKKKLVIVSIAVLIGIISIGFIIYKIITKENKIICTLEKNEVVTTAIAEYKGNGEVEKIHTKVSREFVTEQEAKDYMENEKQFGWESEGYILTVTDKTFSIEKDYQPEEEDEKYTIKQFKQDFSGHDYKCK